MYVSALLRRVHGLRDDGAAATLEPPQPPLLLLALLLLLLLCCSWLAPSARPALQAPTRRARS